VTAVDATSEGSGEREERACLVALSTLRGIGPATLLTCLSESGAVDTWDAIRSGRGVQIASLAAAARRQRDPSILDRWAGEASSLDPHAVLERHEAAGQQVLIYGRPGYPERLLDDPAPPAVVFVHGSLDSLDGPTVAIVGTRNATHLGRTTASLLAGELAQRGIGIISGLALGIDGAAHEAVVGRVGGGVPIGVVATGLERAYPRRHLVLHRQVAAKGALISESPIGSAPTRWRFPARNRIIAGLADAVVVVESRSAGGSMLTAAEALVRNVPVLAVPGHPTSPGSAGALDLICDGAVPVRDVTDVLVAIGLGGLDAPAADRSPSSRRTKVSPGAQQVLEALEAGPRTFGELILAGSLDLDEASAALVELEQAELVVRSGGWFERSNHAATASAQGPRP
jgi:DNA processing protein